MVGEGDSLHFLVRKHFSFHLKNKGNGEKGSMQIGRWGTYNIEVCLVISKCGCFQFQFITLIL